jgi:hypothetical protein
MKPALVLPFTDFELPEPVEIAGKNARLSAGTVRTQLSAILRSSGFIRAERMRRFLKFIVEETLAGRSNRLCEYSIGIAVFQRNETFEPGIDPIVRNDARRLRQKLLEYYQQSRPDDEKQIVIDLPKGGYVPVFKRTSRPSRTARQYRLTITLTRIADDAEIWTTKHEY